MNKHLLAILIIFCAVASSSATNTWLTFPVGGETFCKNDPYIDVEFDPVATPFPNARFELRKNGTVLSTGSDVLYFGFPSATEGSNYKVRIYNEDDPTIFQESGFFSISEDPNCYNSAPLGAWLSYPSGGEVFCVGGNNIIPVEIDESLYPFQDAKLELRKGSTVLSSDLVQSNELNTGELYYGFLNTAQYGDDFKVRLYPSFDPSIYVESGAFSIEDCSSDGLYSITLNGVDSPELDVSFNECSNVRVSISTRASIANKLSRASIESVEFRLYTSPTTSSYTAVSGVRSYSFAFSGFIDLTNPTAGYWIEEVGLDASGQAIFTSSKTQLELNLEVADAGSNRSFVDFDLPYNLGGNPSGGTWSGEGVFDNTFYPSVAGPGSHTLTYSACNSNDQATYQVNSSIIISTTGSFTLDNNSSILLTLDNAIYDTYKWYKDGVLSYIGSQLNVTQPGFYEVIVTKGGLTKKLEGVDVGYRSYVQSVTAIKEVDKTSSAIATSSRRDRIEYVDGIGRINQVHAVNQSPSGSDIISLVEFDEYGRSSREYLPYVKNMNGAFDENASMNQLSFYAGSLQGKSSSAIPYADMEYEESPLGRLKKRSPEGIDVSSYHNIEFDYELNLESDQVIQWDNLSMLGSLYETGQLFKNTRRDEDGKVSIEFLDNQGKTILKRAQVATNEWADTYYVYDDFERLQYVIPPEVSRVAGEVNEGLIIRGFDLKIFDFTVSSSGAPKIAYKTGSNVKVPPGVTLSSGTHIKPVSEVISNEVRDRDLFCYTYENGSTGLMTGKKVPGGAWIYMVYDQWDRLVLTQDGNQRLNNQWVFIKYDALNRPVMTGFYTDNRSASQIQTSLLSETVRYESYQGSGDKGYSDVSFPRGITDSDILTVTYYDNYDFVSISDLSGTNYQQAYTASGPFLMETPSVRNDKIKGQVTGTLTRAEGNDFITSITYYDRKYRPIQIVSENHLDPNGQDVVSTQYDFVGNTRNTQLEHFDGSKTTLIKRRFTYDLMDRLIHAFHKVNNEGEVLISRNEYNEIGELITKQLHSKDNGATSEQTLDYTYDIRGWLTSINQSDLTNSDDLFGMELYYEANPFESSNINFNGNISAMQWSNYDSKAENISQRGYSYDYDDLNRLKKANHFINSSTSTSAYDVEIPSYDLNGNIERLTRKMAGGANMDNLTYHYDGNQLQRVDDSWNDSEGFTENGGGTDYTYDANGNMLSDANKGITAIAYNHLNLPTIVTMSTSEGAGRIEYLYDAEGVKLQKKVYQEGNLVNTTDYVGEFIYETEGDNPRALSLIQQEEGRIIPLEAGHAEFISGAYEHDYQYHLKDHLGNVRMTFSTTPENYATVETFESGEDNGFQDLQRVTNSNANTTSGGNEVALLQSGDTGGMILLSLDKGDTIDLSVNANYEVAPSNNHFLSTGYNALFSAFDAVYGGGIEGGVTSSSSVFNEALSGVDMSGKGTTSSAPRAFLNYIRFDEEMNYVSAGFLQISTAAQGVGVHETIRLTDIIADREGYLLAYLSNENATAVNVHFDDFTVYQGKTHIVQTDDYYPFGLTYNSTKRIPSKENLWRFQGQEHQKETGWDQYKWRNADPAIGRFFNIDPLAEDYYYNSVYAFSENKVVAHVELEGLESEPVNEEATIDDSEFELIVSIGAQGGGVMKFLGTHFGAHFDFGSYQVFKLDFSEATHDNPGFDPNGGVVKTSGVEAGYGFMGFSATKETTYDGSTIEEKQETVGDVFNIMLGTQTITTSSTSEIAGNASTKSERSLIGAGQSVKISPFGIILSIEIKGEYKVVGKNPEKKPFDGTFPLDALYVEPVKLPVELLKELE